MTDILDVADTVRNASLGKNYTVERLEVVEFRDKKLYYKRFKTVADIWELRTLYKLFEHGTTIVDILAYKNPPAFDGIYIKHDIEVLLREAVVL